MSISRSSVLRVALTVGLLGAAGVSLAATVFEGVNSPACPGCPNSGIKLVESSFRFGPLMTCGSGITLSKGALTLRDPIDKCPTFVIVEPKRDVPTPKVGFLTVPGAMAPVIEYRFSCATRWLFSWIPIPIGSSCRLDDSKELYRLQSYTERPCGQVSTATREVK